ncbi:MAG: PAS domain S-box protein [Kaiparowitsia implicata GSE-PSE-MK54-09C]|jgi:diguanylate cyclase (GGDEF)-like protein/PAS domain S-box-containing protein|nr:PAS domain S-box protein [Kaiparowitsia implicata GSE-PSE-MK54-09C]
MFLNRSCSAIKAALSPSDGTDIACSAANAGNIETLQRLIGTLNIEGNVNEALAGWLSELCQLTGWELGQAWLPSVEDATQVFCAAVHKVTADASFDAACAPRDQTSSHFDGNKFLEEGTPAGAIAPSILNACVGTTLPCNQGLLGHLWQQQSPQWIMPVGDKVEPELASDLTSVDFQALNLAGLMVLPLYAPGPQPSPVLALLLFSLAPPALAIQQWMEALRAIAPQLALLLQLKQSQAALRQHQTRLAELMDSLPGIVFITDNSPNWSMRYLSQGCYSLTGYHSDELVGAGCAQTFNDITQADDLPRVLGAIAHAVAQRKAYVTEYRICTKQGEEKWLWEKGYGVYNEVGEVQALEGFITDITERKRVEQALQTSEARFRTLFQTTSIGIAFTTNDGTYTESNPAFCAMLGYSSDELKQRNFQSVTYPDDLDLDLAEYKALLASRLDSYQIEKRYIHKQGHTMWGQLTVSAIRRLADQSVVAFGMVQDITERKRAEEALCQSETRNRDILKSIPELLFLIHQDGTYLHVQAEQTEDLPRPAPELIGRRYDEVLPDDLTQLVQEALHRVVQTGAGQTINYQMQLNGQLKCFEARVGACGSEAFIMTVRNTTERQRAERVLQEKEAFLQLILDNLPQYIFWKDKDLVYQGANQMFADSAGLSSTCQIKGKTDFELWPANLAEIYQTSDRSVLATTQPILHVLREKPLANGDTIWQDICKVPIHDAEGRVIGVLGTSEDITERKRAEEALELREAYLGALVELQQVLLSADPIDHLYPHILKMLGKVSNASRVYVFENSQDETGQIVVNQRYEWCAEGIQPYFNSPLLQGIPYANLDAAVVATLASGGTYSRIATEYSQTEQEIFGPQGIQSVLLLPLLVNDAFYGFIGFDNCVAATPWQPLEVGLLRAAGTAISIALERRLATAALQQSEFRHRLLADYSTDLISRFTPAGECLYASPAAIALLGYAPDELVGRCHDDFIHPEDRENMRRVLSTIVLQPGVEVSPYSYRIRRQDGQYIWLETRGKAVFSPDCPTQLEIVVTSRDITERKQTDSMLARQRLVLEMVARDRPLPETLNLLVQIAEEQSQPGVIGSLLLLDANGTHLRHGASPNLPMDYCQALDGLAIGPKTGSCGTAMYRAETVIVADIATDTLWQEYRDLALRHGLRACWSMPILSSQGRVLGSFAMYRLHPGIPTNQDMQVMDMVTQLAAIAIEQKRAEEALQKAEARYRGIFENAVEGIFQSTVDGRYLIVNPMLARIYGYDSPKDLIQQLTSIREQLYVDSLRRDEFVYRMSRDGAVLGFESEVYRKDGSTIWISECARALYDDEGQLIGYEGTVEDITRRKLDEAELLKRDNLLQGVANATNHLLTNPNLDTAIPQVLWTLGKTAQVDRVYVCRNHAHPETQELASTMQYEWVRELVRPTKTQPHWRNQSYREFGLERWLTAFQEGASVSGIVREFPQAERDLLQRDDILSILMMPIFVEGALWGYVGFDDCRTERFWSASEGSILVAIAASIGSAIKRQHTEEKMRHQAFHDSLTGLPNRHLFSRCLSQTLAQAERTEDMFAVLFLDLDHFKTINDTLGHAVGDELLRQATQRMTQCLRVEDTIARWGGDEFTLLLPTLKHPEDAARVAQRIAESLLPSFRLEDHDLHVSCSIGIAIYPNSGSDAQALLKNADTALYRAKDQGRNNYQFFTDLLNQQASERLTLDSNLHQALRRDELVLHYQPQFNLNTGAITQMEALIRWQHPQFGLVPPYKFIALAEENGLILPIGEWVLRTACMQHRRWQTLGCAPSRIAVNLSARQFQQPNLAERVAQILSQTGLTPECLELEITETAVMNDVEFTTQTLHALRAMGVSIAMDDFGTGYSSLNYLKRFPLHTLKIDRSFVQDFTTDSADIAIITAIITLGQGLHLSVVAEGVETSAQKEFLTSLGCEEMQGFWFGKPLPAEAATAILQANQFNRPHRTHGVDEP